MDIQVEGQDSLYRDSDTGAIINKDKKSFEQVRAARKLVDRRDREITELRAELEVLKSMIRATM